MTKSLSRIAACCLILLSVTGCFLPGDPGTPGLGLSRQGEAIVVHPPVCQVEEGATVRVFSTFPGTNAADKELWSAQVVGGIAPGDAVLLDSKNPDLTAAAGDYPLDAVVVVSVEVAGGRRYVYGGTVRNLPEQGVIYEGATLTAAEYSASVAQDCAPD